MILLRMVSLTISRRTVNNSCMDRDADVSTSCRSMGETLIDQQYKPF